jgi:LysM repeat protein
MLGLEYQHTGLATTQALIRNRPDLIRNEIMLRELAAKDPKAKGAKPEEFVNLTFVKELDSSGFIDRLYKTQPAVAMHETPLAPAAVITQETPAQASTKARPVREEIKAVSTPAASATGSGEYTVAPGDTLSYLALKYYGDQYKWERIYEANKQTMRDSHSLYVGQKITIPLLDGKLFGDQTLPISSHLPDYPLERRAAGTTNILDLR